MVLGTAQWFQRDLRAIHDESELGNLNRCWVAVCCAKWFQRDFEPEHVHMVK